jgi:hypothetical protein
MHEPDTAKIIHAIRFSLTPEGPRRKVWEIHSDVQQALDEAVKNVPRSAHLFKTEPEGRFLGIGPEVWAFVALAGKALGVGVLSEIGKKTVDMVYERLQTALRQRGFHVKTLAQEAAARNSKKDPKLASRTRRTRGK